MVNEDPATPNSMTILVKIKIKKRLTRKIEPSFFPANPTIEAIAFSTPNIIGK